MRVFIFSLSSLAILTTIGITLHALDMPVARFVRSFDIHEVNQVGDLLAIPGRGEVIAGAFILIGFLGWWLTRERLMVLGLRGLVALVGSTVIVQLLKHLIGRPRPRLAHADDFTLGPSLAIGLDAFPSGHACNAFAAASVLAWLAPGLRVPAFLIAGLVGLSRIVRGSHFPTDVFAGAMLGVLIGSLAATGFKRWREEALPGLIQTGVPITVSVFLVVWIALHQTPVWSQEVWHLSGGAALILVGILMRGLATVQTGHGNSPLQTAGGLALIVGVAVACGPWWGAVLLLAALLPLTLPFPMEGESALGGQGEGGKEVMRGLNWKREGFTVGVVLLAVAAIRSVKGVLPLG